MTDLPEAEPRRRRFPRALAAWMAAAVMAIAAIYWMASTGLLSWGMAVDSRAAAERFVAQNMLLAYAAYIALFVVLAVILFPAQLWIIVFGAMVFGFWQALIVSWFAAVLSSICVFVLARGVLGDRYRARAGKYLGRIEEGFKRDQLSWMLTMRFIPVVPYCISNVAPAFLGARLAPFLVATMIGVIPYVAAYTFAGDRAGAVLDKNEPPAIASLAADMLPIMLAIAALPALALLVRRMSRPERK